MQLKLARIAKDDYEALVSEPQAPAQEATPEVGDLEVEFRVWWSRVKGPGA